MELALPHAEAGELARDRRGERPAAALRAAAAIASATASNRACAAAESRARALQRVAAGVEPLQLGLGAAAALEQLVVGSQREAALRVGDAIEPRLHLLEPAGIGVEGLERSGGASLRPRAGGATSSRSSSAARASSGASALERGERALGRRGERARAVAVLRRERLAAAACAPAPSSATCRSRSRSARSASSLPGSSPSVSSASARELVEPLRSPRRASARQLLVTRRAADAARATPSRASPRAAAPRPQNASSRSSWYDGRASRRCSNWPDMRDQPLRGGGDVLPSGRPSPRVGARAPVGEDTAGEHEARLVLGPQLGERLEPVLVEESLGTSSSASTYASSPAGADRRRVAVRPEQEADRLGEDRLAGSGLAGERVQPGRELELGLADEDEVLDPQRLTRRNTLAKAPGSG